MIKTRKGESNRVCQGDIFRDIEFIEHIEEKDGIVEVSKIVFPLVIVLTQDCDLEQDSKSRRPNQDRDQDKWLISVLVAPLYNLEHVYLGEHLSELGMEMQRISQKNTPGKYLKSNQRPRFHYLEFYDRVPIVPSVIDFKHYFSVNVNNLRRAKKTKFVCSVSTLFREDISQRFTSYLGRIGLPSY